MDKEYQKIDTLFMRESNGDNKLIPSEEVVHYMDIETYIEPEHMIQSFNGRVRVIVPERW